MLKQHAVPSIHIGMTLSVKVQIEPKLGCLPC